eukprot:comp22390_c0_seq1/m.33403 comp22390_c0_seq1/g.33403  ORF comp22390_c0_seq1/g.33403 comp22390_c0_seq1/m.33403 type:complete len:254 (-) comp22390_c0_seq1:116-877(-)
MADDDGLLDDLEDGGARKRRKHVRFGVGDDIKLLRLVIAQMPFKERHGAKKIAWDNVATLLSQEVNLDVNGRKCQEHVESMLNQFAKNDGEFPRKTGTEEEHITKSQLLLELSELMEEHRMTKQASGGGGPMSSVRHMHTDFMDASEVEDPQARLQLQRTRAAMERIETANYYREKRTKRQEELETKQQMLRVEKEKLELARERLQFDKWKFQEELEERKAEREERKQRLDLEIEERRTFLQLLRAQHGIVDG